MDKRLILLCSVLLLLFSVFFEPILHLQSAFSNRDRQNISVLIDPGHGGIDGGAVGITGTVEKGINLDISKRTSDLFGLFGISCILTRYEDTMLGEPSNTIRSQKNADLRARVKMANEMTDACLLSIHLNSFSDPSCHGAQVFYAPIKSSKDLAKAMQATLRQGLDSKNLRVVKPAESGHYILNHVKIPSILIECGFLSNRIEEANLSNAEYQKRLAACIVQGYRNNRN